MKRKTGESGFCQITGEKLPLSELVSGYSIRRSIIELIRKSYPDFDVSGYISHSELNRFRQLHLRNMISGDRPELSQDHQDVLNSFIDPDFISRNIDDEDSEKLKIGDRIADRVAVFGGSWTFIIIFFMFILSWMVINTVLLIKRPYDPYPFILLNLILSCLAAIQAPIIMMSQNRLESKDRARAKNDYRINLKAEVEVRQLHEKLDHLISYQMDELYKKQEMQLDYLEAINEVLEAGRKGKNR